MIYIMKKLILGFCVLSLMWTNKTMAQMDKELIPPSNLLDIAYPRAYGTIEAINLYDGLYRINEGNQPISYVAFFPQFLALDRPVELMDGEGQNGYLLEGNVDQFFKVARGRMGNGRFWQTSTLFIRYSPLVRLSLDNDSKPTVPLSNKIAVRIEKGLWDNHSFQKNLSEDKKEEFKSEEFRFENESIKTLKSLVGAAEIAHYSNGQRSGSLIDTLGDMPNVIRNDYSSGDFSTNYVKFSLTYSHLQNNQLFSGSLGYRHDFGAPGVAEYTPTQEHRYGHHRLYGFAQYRFKPFVLSKRKFQWYNTDTDQVVEINRLIEARVRVEFEYILDPKSELYLYDRGDNYYKFSTSVIGQINPLKWETVGLFAHFFYGRDYSNIRYDDPVVGLMFGITLSIKKYIPPFMNESVYVDDLK